MAKGDFTRTSLQVEQDIGHIVDSIDRSLDSSNGESERKGHFVMSAFVSVLAVFASILGIGHFVGRATQTPVSADVGSDAYALTSRDIRLIEQHLERTREQSRLIRETKDRVAPAMAIDGNLNAIDNSMSDVGALIGATEQPLK